MRTHRPENKLFPLVTGYAGRSGGISSGFLENRATALLLSLSQAPALSPPREDGLTREPDKSLSLLARKGAS